jgi:hypothetical protein
VFTWLFQTSWALLAGCFFVRPFWPARQPRLFALPCGFALLAMVTAVLHQPLLCAPTRSFPSVIPQPGLAYAVITTFTLLGPLVPPPPSAAPGDKT